MRNIKKIATLLLAIMFMGGFCFAQANPESYWVNDSSVESSAKYEYQKSGTVYKSEDSGKNNVEITVAVTSDMHGRIYPFEYATVSDDSDAGFALTYGVVKKVREENPDALLIDIGDTVQDNSAELFNDMDIHPMVEALNYQGYDVWVPGNHEFNFGLSFLERNFDAFDGRVVCSNIEYADDNSSFILPYQIFVIDGVRVAVVSAVAPHVPQWEASTPEHFQGLYFSDPIEAVKRTVKSIEGKYDVLIGAMHISRNGEYEQENVGGVFQMAEAIPELDIIFAGHEHATYAEKVNNTWVLEPGRYGSQVSIGQIHVAKENGKWTVVDVMAKNVDTKNMEPNKAILDKFKWVHEESLENANTVIGEITEDFIDGVDYITGENEVTTMPRAQVEDSAVMDLINTVQLEKSGADVASCALFKSNQTLFKGPFKKKDVAFIYKYDNTLMGVNMTGKSLLSYMEWSASFYNTYKEGDVTISFNPDVRSYNYDMFAGINYKIDISKEAGHRIVDATINGKKVDPNKVYKVAVNNYRFGTVEKNGWATADDIYYRSSNEQTPAIRDLIRVYVQEELNGKLSPSCDHNWEIIGTGKSFNDPKVLEMIRNGEITIPTSSDGRTMNVKAVNIHNL